MSKVTDPIADLLTRIRNALHAKHPHVDVPASGLKREITKILADEGYVRNYLNVDDGTQGFLRIFLKYDRDGNSTITGLKRVSKPGLRQYVGYREVPRVRNNLGIAVLSTPKGVLTGQRARHEKVGGELLLFVW
ncbi:MAG TPA: 30S ribosomal protein S8 [Bacteroidetes bacterium]|nr:30S ribosomal protein S8 [bacterium BMS3Bbin04]HDO65178.1 30S ribosomal protein S8 [Bacteroidota bacterium]HEX04303.1 30S ribosomal protein S8 [Bacteroidota bacterium]